MGDNSKIAWTDATWNPVTGCTPVSPGCAHCYAKRHALRFWGDRKFTDVQCHEDRLDRPLRWRSPRRIFVNSMSDLFHEAVPFEFISRVFDVMCSWRWPNKAAMRRGDEEDLEPTGHLYQVLTKRPETIWSWLDWVFNYWPGDTPLNVELTRGSFPPHIWMGASVETQTYARDRIPLLLRAPFFRRFLSCEPLLGPIDLYRAAGPVWWGGIYWVVVGGESGPHHRAMKIEWLESLVEQCRRVHVPIFVKQDSALRPGTQGRIPDELWIQEYPAWKGQGAREKSSTTFWIQ